MDNLKTSLKKILEFTASDAESAADELIKKYRNHQTLAAAEYEELSRIESLGADGAMMIKLAYSLASRAKTDKFRFGSAHREEEIIEYLRALFYTLSNETVYALMLDDRGRVTNSVVVSEGTINSSTVLPRRVLELVVKCGASSIILAHNHPLGYANPSLEDIETTFVLKNMLASTGRQLLAHYVVASDGMYYKIDPAAEKTETE